jgi:hypothetical protein
MKGCLVINVKFYEPMALVKKDQAQKVNKKVEQKCIIAFLNSSLDSFQSISTSFSGERGWKDWHICVALLLFTVVHNKKVNVVKR